MNFIKVESCGFAETGTCLKKKCASLLEGDRKSSVDAACRVKMLVVIVTLITKSHEHILKQWSLGSPTPCCQREKYSREVLQCKLFSPPPLFSFCTYLLPQLISVTLPAPSVKLRYKTSLRNKVQHLTILSTFSFCPAGTGKHIRDYVLVKIVRHRLKYPLFPIPTN